MSTPLLIVLTPVRNEAWVLHAFLKATSLWADYIIIADQMSTDGSRDIYPQYEKVKVIDNPRHEMHQARTRKLLFEAAMRIEGDKILFALDADEFLSGDFVNTAGWKTILQSHVGDVFLFRWTDLLPGFNKCTISQPLYWAAHLNDDDMNGIFPDNYIHEWRLPWPKQVESEYIIEDIAFIHFARVNEVRQKNKEIFYQVSTAFNEVGYSGVKLYRHYHKYNSLSTNEIIDTLKSIYAFYEKYNLNILAEINLNDVGQHYIDSILDNFTTKGLKHFSKLDIWDADFVKKYKLKNPQSIVDKLIISYLRSTKKYTHTFVVKAIDFILKKIY